MARPMAVLPEEFSTRELTCWAKPGDKEADRFAGAARYTITINLPDAVSQPIGTQYAVYKDRNGGNITFTALNDRCSVRSHW